MDEYLNPETIIVGSTDLRERPGLFPGRSELT